MSRILPAILLRFLILLLLAVGALMGVATMMFSLNDYRSLISNLPPVPGDALFPPGTPSITRRVVVVLIDGLREDTALNSQVMPFLAQLRQEGAWATMHSRPPAYSEAGYTTLLTGAWPDLSDGHTINAEYSDIRTFTQDDIFSETKRIGLKTAISGFYWFEKLVPQTSVDYCFYTPGDDAEADQQVLDSALPWLENDLAQLILIHFDQVDYAGHYEGGPRDPRWDQAATRVDELLHQIVAKLDLSQDSLLVLSDHGHIDAGGHGGQEPVVLREPFVLIGASVRPGHYVDLNMVDVAPTLAALLGTSLPASNQGEARSEMLNLPEQVVAGLPAVFQAQQKQLLENYQQQMGNSVPVVASKDVVSTYQATLATIRQQRLTGELVLRLPIALATTILPFSWLRQRPQKNIIWLIGTGFLYLFIFNFIYAVIDKSTYSLSSIYSPTDLLLNIARTASLSLVFAWLVYFLGQRLYRQSSSQSILLNLDMVLVVTYLLLLPYLVNFVLNGVRVTWTLPDFLTSFLGFLSLLQIFMVVVVGMLLSGLAGLITRITPRKVSSL
jgi:hypothetical protein